MIRLLAAVALTLLTTVHVWAADVRVYIFKGHVGELTSLGLRPLSSQIGNIDKRVKVTLHGWANGHVVNTVAADIRRLPASTRIVLVGYSVGAGAATWIAAGLPHRKIELVVAYDPSWMQTFPAVGPNVARALLYRNRCAPIWGRGVILGPQVETTEVCSLHLAVASNQSLHARTIAAVKRVLQ